MNRWMAMCLIVAAAVARASTAEELPSDANLVCSDSWYRSIEERVPTGDGQAHGPDVGSDEWKSVVEFKLGIRDTPDVPERDGEAWCRYIDQIVRNPRTSDVRAAERQWKQVPGTQRDVLGTSR